MTASGPATRTARSSRQVESRPPENITTTAVPDASRPSARTAASISDSVTLLLLTGDEDLGRLVEALELYLGDQLELEVRPGASTTGLVTSTSPAAERAATREAMLTSRP